MLNSKSKVNAIYLTFGKQPGFSIRIINHKSQKIDNTMLDIYKIVIIAFFITDKINRVKFFEKIFLVINIILKVVFGMSFLIFSTQILISPIKSSNKELMLPEKYSQLLGTSS